ncbi:OmpA family protein [Hyphomicrobium sp. CS1GBMeth3]|uniref:OmpA family protein n=1 Tax=Hyphomicrobium sp. CS1GBMeth3 TaxID=1892845 RepID=UPI0011146E96|nr:OmpA family protein [Hyphomicrobium sp. CS1GBMeth3]
MPSLRIGCAPRLQTAIRSHWRARAMVGGFAAVAFCGAAVAQAQNGAGFNDLPDNTHPFDLNTPHDGFSVVDPLEGVPERRRESDEGVGSWFFPGWSSKPSAEKSAEDLYKAGTAALEAGRREEAQRLFEQVISQDPGSARARAARQQLGEIYRGVTGEPQAIPAARSSVTGPTPRARNGGVDSASVLSGISQAVSPTALLRARVSPAVDGQFLSDAGDRVFFGTGNAGLGSRARGVIQAQARFLIRFPNLYVAIEGYADDGAMSDEDVQRLSEERAAVVRDRLIAEGVGAERIIAYGRGGGGRVSDCPAPECMAQNRRAVTILLMRRIETRPVRHADGDDQPGPGRPPMQ